MHAPLGLRVQLGVLDRAGDLGCDRDEQLDLALGERTLLPGAHVEGSLELFPREDRHGEDRFVVVLAEIRERFEAWIEVRLRRDHDRRALGCGNTGDALAAAHARHPGLVLDTRAVRRPQHELVGALVVEVDEAGVGLERSGSLVRNRLHHLL